MARNRLHYLSTFPRNPLKMLHHRHLNFRLNNLMRLINRKLNKTQLLQLRHPPQRIISAKDSPHMVFDLGFTFAIVRAEHRERLGSKYMMRGWHYDSLRVDNTLVKK